jgi:hypothetical protein
MQLEELQTQWQRLDDKLERALKVEGELLRMALTRAARRRINRLAIWPVIDVTLCVATLLLTGAFLSHHWADWALVAPAGIVMVAAILLLISGVRQLVQVFQIDWDGAVAEIQSSLTRLRIERIRQFKWVMLASPLVGFCGLVVGLQWLLDRLPEQHFLLDKITPWWVAGNYAFGVLFILFGQLIVRFLRKKFQFHGWWQRVLDDISGSTINTTTAELQRWTSLKSSASQ